MVSHHLFAALTAAAALSVLAEFGINFDRARIVAVVVGLLPGFGAAAYKGVLSARTRNQVGRTRAGWEGISPIRPF